MESKKTKKIEKIKKNILKILAVLLYICANVIFYNSIFVDFSNIHLAFISGFLFVIELVFWHYLLDDLIEINKIEISKKQQKRIKILIYVALIVVGLSRVFLHSSPYFNDSVNTNQFLILLIGGARILALYNSLLIIFMSFDSKNIFYILISMINTTINMMIWIDMDMDITSLLRISLSILYILNLCVLKMLKFKLKFKLNRKVEEDEVL